MKQETIPEISITKQYLLSNSQITLATICKNIVRYRQPMSNSIVGIVTDCTKPLFRTKQKNYIVQIKIIDDSLNDSNIFGVMCKDCTVYLISNRKKQLQKLITNIGQLIVLDKFTFSLWNGIKLETKYLKMTEGLYVIDNEDQDIRIRSKLTMNPQLFEFSQNLKARIKYLRQWRQNQMYKYFGPKLGINIMNNHCAMVQPFNMILKISQQLIQTVERTQEQTKNRKFSRIMITDDNGNRFGLSKHSNQIDEQQIQIESYIINQQRSQISDLYHELTGNYKQIVDKQALIYIRGIKTISQNLEIQLTQTGNILGIAYQIPKPSNYMNYMAIHREGQKCLVQNRKHWSFLNKDGTINEQLNPITVLTDQQNMNNFTYLQNLLQIQDKYNHSNKKDQILINDTYYLKVIALKYSGDLKLYHRQYQILIDEKFYHEMSAEEKKQCKQYRKIGYIYQGSIFAIDRSIQSKGKAFQIKIFNCDDMGSFLLNYQNQKQFSIAEQAIGTKTQESTKKKLKQIIDQKLTSLCTKSDFNSMANLVVQPIRSEKLLFRLVNTKIV